MGSGGGGKFLWAATGGCIASAKANSIALDSAGASHIAGAFYTKAGNPLTFGAVKLFSRGSWDIFVARADKSVSVIVLRI